ncbi:thymine dioxygenase [Mycena vulgaris]|nr:thymine dioxygenase [Mycena vulgaris]
MVPGDAGISVVDFAPFLDGSDKQAVADAILASFKRVGFVYLLNHGIPSERRTKMFDLSKEFFAQPLEVKKLAPHPPSGAHHRGYSAPGREKVTYGHGDAGVPDVKEHFECGREEDDEMPNIWLPDGVLPGFKENCLDFYWFCYEVEISILRALALGLGLAENYFDQYHKTADKSFASIDLLSSVPAESLLKEEVGRISAHTDYTSITPLMQDEVGGLEIEDPHTPGVFRPVPPIHDALVVNAGDFMMRCTPTNKFSHRKTDLHLDARNRVNDTIRSTMHRVRAPPGLGSEAPDGMAPERYSIPYDLDTVVDCIPGTWNAERPKKYEPISVRFLSFNCDWEIDVGAEIQAREYVMERLAAAY